MKLGRLSFAISGVLFTFIINSPACAQKYQEELTLHQAICVSPELTQFCQHIEDNPNAIDAFHQRNMTVFAPNNEAFSQFRGNFSVLYHLAGKLMKLEEFSTPVSAFLNGNFPLFITQRAEDDFYINQARIIRNETLFQKGKNLTHILYTIESVLEPLQTIPNAKISLQNPHAFHFMIISENLVLGNYSIKKFRRQVVKNKEDSIFKDSKGVHTFFMPVDEAFKDSPNLEFLDGKAIEGHVIPNEVIFTSFAEGNRGYTSMAFDEKLKTEIKFSRQDDAYFVKSVTHLEDKLHTASFFPSKIVKANVPVKNGVVHFIDRPLVIVKWPVLEVLEKVKSLSRSLEMIKTDSGDFLDQINRMEQLTLLAPSNEAWNNCPNLQEALTNSTQAHKILAKHVLREAYSSQKLKQLCEKGVEKSLIVDSLHSSLKFRLLTKRNHSILAINDEGGNAKLIETDLKIQNGYMHVIDHVLGCHPKKHEAHSTNHGLENQNNANNISMATKYIILETEESKNTSQRVKWMKNFFILVVLNVILNTF